MTLRMNKKVLLPISLLAMTSASIFASNATYQATITSYTEPTLAPTTALDFGKILPTAGSVCTMDNAGAVTGQCDAAGTATLGVVTLSGMTKNAAMNLTVTGSTTGPLTFVATSTATGGTAPVTTANGTPSALTVDATGSDVVVDVYGQMTADSQLTSGTAYQVDYTVAIDFQ